MFDHFTSKLFMGYQRSPANSHTLYLDLQTFQILSTEHANMVTKQIFQFSLSKILGLVIVKLDLIDMIDEFDIKVQMSSFPRRTNLCSSDFHFADSNRTHSCTLCPWTDTSHWHIYVLPCDKRLHPLLRDHPTQGTRCHNIHCLPADDIGARLRSCRNLVCHHILHPKPGIFRPSIGSHRAH